MNGFTDMAENTELLEALKALRNEVTAMLGIAGVEIREAIGWANADALLATLEQADAAIAKAEEGK